MRRIVLAVILLAFSASANAQAMFYEYVEGSGHNKALEIHNATGSAIDLDDLECEVQMYFNRPRNCVPFRIGHASRRGPGTRHDAGMTLVALQVWWPSRNTARGLRACVQCADHGWARPCSAAG